MGSVIASFLKTASTRKLLVVGTSALAVAGLALAVLPMTMLRGLVHLLALLLAVGVVAVGLAVVRITAGWVRAAPPEQRTDRMGNLALATVAVLGLGAFAVWSNGFYWKRTRMLCWDAEQAETVDARRQALEEGKRRLRSPFSWLPEHTGFRVSLICAEAEEDLRRLDRGECPMHPLPSVPCRCGSEQWPEDARCEHPQCPRGAQQQRLRCWDDAW